ncbi:transmembrane protein 40 [Grus japonensis]|uniref:Transmembrane protein 40 n=1 Tax=Grus japonensis TaxID=30415 RepID=A0ABC9XA78_GRUJA
MAPTHRLLLVFLLLVALHARAARAAPWRAQGADEDANNGDSWLDVDLEPLEHPGAVPAGEGDPTSQLGSRSEAPADRVVTDVPVGRTFPAPQLDAVPQAGWHRRGPPRARYHQAEGGKKRPEPSPLLRKMLDELERRHETDRETVKKLLFADGSSGSLPVPPDEAQATQGAGTPVLSESGEDHQASRYDFFRADSELSNDHPEEHAARQEKYKQGTAMENLNVPDLTEEQQAYENENTYLHQWTVRWMGIRKDDWTISVGIGLITFASLETTGIYFGLVYRIRSVLDSFVPLINKFKLTGMRKAA